MSGKIKENAKQYFKDKEFKKAIDIIWKLGVYKFISFADRQNWFQSLEICNIISDNDELFKDVFSQETADIVLYDYFNSKNISNVFEQKLAKEFPDTFVHAIRVNLSFLDVERIEFYTTIDLPIELKIHQKVWQHLHNLDKSIWGKIETELSLLLKKEITLSEILIDSIVWLENSRFKNNDTKLVYDLSSVYNLFMQIFMRKIYSTDRVKSLSKENFIRLFIEKLGKPINKNISNFMDSIDNWINFRDSILYPYCFDFTINPRLENNIIHFNRSPKAYYKWELDGTRYFLNRFSYYMKGMKSINYLEENNELQIPKGKKTGDEVINKQLAIQQWQIKCFLADLKIESLIFDNKPIDTSLLSISLLTYSKNRFIRYEKELDKLKKNSKNWTDAYLKILYKSIEKDLIENFPFILMTQDEFKELLRRGLTQLPKIPAQDVINIFSYNTNEQPFDRFNIEYNVWNKPFVCLGDYLFCPTMYLANNDWFYGFAQVGLDNLHKKESKAEQSNTATKMEQHLGEALEKKGWKVKVICNKEANHIDGDVDIIVEDKETTLFIQLKRTRFRLDLKDAYLESIISDRKAMQQLNDAERSLRTKNDIYKLKGELIKWIVTTSYENVLTEKQGCIKINYFDLLHTIGSPNIDKIKDLEVYMKNENGIKEWLNEMQNPDVSEIVKLINLEAGLPIPLAELKKFRQGLFANNNDFIEYNSRYDMALKFAKTGNKEKAIKILKNCLYIIPDDIDVWCNLGNFYADIKDFKNSYASFEKALKIIPDDPFIMRNYALALHEGGRINESSQLYYKLKHQYWFVDLNLIAKNYQSFS